MLQRDRWQIVAVCSRFPRHVQDHIPVRWIRRMRMLLPTRCNQVNFHIARHRSLTPNLDNRLSKIRPALAIPKSRMQNLHCPTVRRLQSLPDNSLIKPDLLQQSLGRSLVRLLRKPGETKPSRPPGEIKIVWKHRPLFTTIPPKRKQLCGSSYFRLKTECHRFRRSSPFSFALEKRFLKIGSVPGHKTLPLPLTPCLNLL